MAAKQPTRRPRTLRQWLMLSALSTVLALALAELATRVLTSPLANGMSRVGPIVLLPLQLPPSDSKPPSAATEKPYIVPDAELGWCTGPDAKADGCSTNVQAARGGPAGGYTKAVPAGKVRVVTFGDSFTHCDEVVDADTWQAQLVGLRPDIEAANFGVPGYGTDQAFLRWRRESRALDATVSILCIWPENICRNLNLDRFFLVPSGPSSRKPRFVLRDGRLESRGQPCVPTQGLAASPFIAADDVWCDAGETEWHAYYHVRLLRLAASSFSVLRRRSMRAAMYSDADPRANEITLAICRQFAAEARDRGTRPVVLLIPMRDLLAEYPGGERALPLVRMLLASGIETWDLSPAFAGATNLDALNPPHRHMTPQGNRVIAETLAARLPKAL